MSKEKIIGALEGPNAKQAREIIAELRGEVGAFKIGLQLFTAAGAALVRETVEAGIKIFLDLKFHDIPNTTAKASIEAARQGVWMFNLHALGGSEMMRRTIEEVSETCAKENLAVPKIIGVTVLTSANDETLREGGIETDTKNQVLKLAKLAAAAGLNGVVASPHEIKIIRAEITDRNFFIVTPGIRNHKSQTSNFKPSPTDDQKRTLSAGEAVRDGADYLVIGRPILSSANLRLAVKEIIDDIANQIETETI
ncbi:MAG: orotidine-5'-phosphate decarboxylase [Pyrinomonadaceae bacterium]